MSFGRLSEIIKSIEKELDTILQPKKGKKAVYLDQDTLNLQMVSIHQNLKMNIQN